MRIPTEWAGAYWASNEIALALLFLAWKCPAVSRILFSVMFLSASVINARLALIHPAEYLDYAKFTFLEPYRQFILGYFAEHTQPIVLAIALGQALIGAFLLAKRTTKVGAFGASAFLLAIVPLGVGSAFPFSLVCVLALAVMVRQTASAGHEAKSELAPNLQLGTNGPKRDLSGSALPPFQ